MYESCPEAHRKWLKAEAGREMSNRGEGITYLPYGVRDFGMEAASFYESCAATSWNAHNQGVCSCRYKK